MAIFQVDIFKKYGEETWANVYHLAFAPGDDMDDAKALAMANGESGLHYASIIMDKVRYRPYPVVSGSYVELPLQYPGGRAGIADLPFFVVARDTIRATSGKPGIKMYRGALSEADIEGVGNTTAAVRTLHESFWDAFLLDHPELCKPNGVHFLDGSLNIRVGMRQIHQRRGHPTP